MHRWLEEQALGTRFTSHSVAQALSIEAGPASTALKDCRLRGGLALVDKQGQHYVYELIDKDKLLGSHEVPHFVERGPRREQAHKARTYRRLDTLMGLTGRTPTPPARQEMSPSTPAFVAADKKPHEGVDAPLSPNELEGASEL